MVQAEEDPDVKKVSLVDAKTELTKAFKKLPQLAHRAKLSAAATSQSDAAAPVVWRLALDELEDTGVDMRPRLPLPGHRDLTGASRAAQAAIPDDLKPISLDALTVADDEHYLTSLAAENNLPTYVASGLKKFYN
jgi:hypothetical protein